MLLSFLYKLPSYVDVLIIISVMMLCLKFGYWVKKRKIRKDPSFSHPEGSAVEGALLGLLALLLAFTFSMSASRFEERRDIVVQEANNIFGAIRNADLYPDSTREQFRNYLKQYVEARIDYFKAQTDDDKIVTAQITTKSLQQKLWAIASADARDKENLIRAQQMLPVLSAMSDIVNTREELRIAKVPILVYWLLVILCFTASFMVGYKQDEKKVDHIMTWIFTIMTALAIYLILDLDRPRTGLIRNEAANENIFELRTMFNTP